MKTKKFKRARSRNSMYLLSLFLMLWMLPQNAFAHCDSYDGPVIQDAVKALDHNKVELVYKWISENQEKEISNLFQKTVQYKEKDREIYELLEKHFFETLVRLHREGEGEPYTGLKPAGTTKLIIQKTDFALKQENIEGLLSQLNEQIEKVVRKKYETVAHLQRVKDRSVEEGRAYVAAYVDYTHTVEKMHELLKHATVDHAVHEYEGGKKNHKL